MNQNTSMYSYIGIFTNFCIFVFILLVEKSSAAHHKYEACAPKPCGRLSIRFPFYIQGVQEPYCGHPGFELNCSNSGSSTIHIPDNDYVIANISYENQSFWVHNALSTSNCLPRIGNITIRTDQLVIADASKLHLLSNCNDSLPEVLWKYRKFACDQKNRDRWGLAMLEDDKNLHRALEECETNVLAPVEVHGDGGGPGGNGVMDYEGMLRRGFVLNWKGSYCGICEKSGGRCGFDTNGYSFQCLCPDEPHLVRCKSKYHAPQVAVNEIDQSNCSALTLPIASGYKGSGHSGLFELLTAEFDLQWHVSDDCYNCYREGNMCRIDLSTESRCANAETGKKNSNVILGTAASVGGFSILVILACCFRRYSFYDLVDILMRKTKKSQDIEDFMKNYGSLAPKRYHYSDVKKMTNSFKIKLGQGGYGSVYKGKLHDCSLVAVKVLKESKGSGEEFINEVVSISRTSHVNIVNLLGFCYEGRKRALIYEFMPNGSLDKFIYGGKSSTDRQLRVQMLYKISVGIARGLEYLHSGCNTRILHFDIKPHNILLDRDFTPKISDFGLAKLCLGKESIVSMLGARGTVGYIAPEVFCKNFGGVSHKSDVYSYGMMVFEMVGGRKNIDVGVNHTSEIYFPDWIYRKIDQSDNLGLDGITNEEENELARKMIIVSLWCIQTDPSSRPSMTKVVEMLEGSHQALQIPPKPFLFSPSGASDCVSTVNMT